MALEVIAGCNDGGGRLIPAGPRAAASAHEDRVLALGVLALGAMEGEDEGMDLLRTFARPMLATSFVLDGIDAMTRPARHAERFERATPLVTTIFKILLPKRNGKPAIQSLKEIVLAKAV